MKEHHLKLFFDGGCRPNPGEMEMAVVARGQTYYVGNIGYGTNNDAEWLALIHALRIALSLGENDIELFGDAALVINQANGIWKCRGPELQAHHATFSTLATQFSRIRIKYVRRSKNLAGIALTRRHAGLLAGLAG